MNLPLKRLLPLYALPPLGLLICLSFSPMAGASPDSSSLIVFDLSKENPKTADKRASDFVNKPVISLLDRKNPSPTGDPHNYFSYARYAWPNPNTPNGLPYIFKDGCHNVEQVAKGDAQYLGGMTSAIRALAIGYALTHKQEYAKKSAEWVRAWFIDPKTRMNPNMEFAQIELGHNNNRGKASGGGILDARDLPEVTDALRLIQNSGTLTPAEQTAARAWFAEYLQWLQTSPQGIADHAKTGNHGNWFLSEEITLARFVGDDTTARALCEEAKQRIDLNIEPDGSQPGEMKREDGITYSMFNLRAFARLTRLARPLGIDLWRYQAPRGGSLPKAVEFLKTYNQHPEKWPYKQKHTLKPGFLDSFLKEMQELGK